MSAAPPANTDRPLALFLDFDGTLVEIAPRPDEVVVPATLRTTLESLRQRLRGALAIVSGRRLGDLLAHLSPLAVAAAGNHGLEYQLQPGRPHTRTGQSLPEAAREAITGYAASHQGLLVEDKGQSLALHCRLAPELANEVAAKMQQIRDEAAPGFTLQAGKMVWELRPEGTNKGTAIREFMRHPPFSGRLPVFFGDDLTDEFGFQTVNELGGWSVYVGDDDQVTAATMRLPNVAAVGDWLGAVAAQLSRDCA